MFAESLLESGNIQRTGRGWSTLVSITFQSALLAGLVALPMLRPDALPPAFKPTSSPIALGRPDAQPAAPTNAQQTAVPRKEARMIFTDPNRPVFQVDRSGEVGPPNPPMPSDGLGRPAGVAKVFDTLIPANPPRVTVRPPSRVIVSRIDPGRLIHQVRPVYPLPAKLARVEGTVVLHALIDREGRITNLQVASGPPLLQTAAREAVRQWRYQPYTLNGVAVEVETQVSVIFKLAH